MSIQTLNWPICTSRMELRTVTGSPLCACTRNVSRETHVPQLLRLSVWFRQDGSPRHYTSDLRQHLNVTFGQHWIGGPVHWPARSPDLSCLDFFWWGQIKTMVYETPMIQLKSSLLASL
ncbi:hypothetical protein AVEN_150894-1 [Araneus ventricosus]|uniref:Uncharacterized protein n=1 Tax=Araneus ventricosus TaxID=182803 RepID=A0A4Y2C9J8_ARAVE|nr:hypothetical protein AVEN_150894-1 [Araneus ventricosus]